MYASTLLERQQDVSDTKKERKTRISTRKPAVEASVSASEAEIGSEGLSKVPQVGCCIIYIHKLDSSIISPFRQIYVYDLTKPANYS
uniref:Uncharacterized protein n=1 Tax=Megaselia scalaris TaxID=36166 RepID=T1GIH3_MEGSC